jgi:biotin carboxyl carrier protein
MEGDEHFGVVVHFLAEEGDEIEAGGPLCVASPPG